MKWIASDNFPNEIKQYHCKDHKGKPCFFYWTGTEPGKIYFKDQISLWLDEQELDAESYKHEWELSEKAHDITIQQLRDTQDARNRWREMCINLAEEMRKAEWDSPLYWEYQKLKASFETGNG